MWRWGGFHLRKTEGDAVFNIFLYLVPVWLVRAEIMSRLYSVYPERAERECIVLLDPREELAVIPYSEKMLFSKILEQPPSNSNHCSSYSSPWQLLSGPDVVLSKREMLFSRAEGYIYFFLTLLLDWFLLKIMPRRMLINSCLFWQWCQEHVNELLFVLWTLKTYKGNLCCWFQGSRRVLLVVDLVQRMCITYGFISCSVSRSSFGWWKIVC